MTRQSRISQPPAQDMNKLERRNARLIATYGITEQDYDRMLMSQSGLCAICHKAPTPGRVLVVDHNHDDGTVRGLLCSECNTGIGLLGDDPATLSSAITYLHLHGDYKAGPNDPPAAPTDIHQTHPGPIEPRREGGDR